MRKRIIAMAVVLGLGIVGVALAQKVNQQPAPAPGHSGATLRSQIIKLRTEIELLQLDHDATRGELLDIMKGIRESESKSKGERGEALALEMLRAGDVESLRKIREAKSLELIYEIIKKADDDERALRDRKKKDYAKQAEELAGKRLDLKNLEEQYHDFK